MSVRPGCKQPPSMKGMSLEAVGLGERVPDWAATQKPSLRESALGLTFCCHCLEILTMFSVSDPPFHSARSQSCWGAVDTEGYLQGGRQRVLRLQGSCHLLSASCSCGGCGLLRYMLSHAAAYVLESGEHMCAGFCYPSKGNTERSHLPPLGRLCPLRGSREAGKGCQAPRSPHLPAKTERPANNSIKSLSLCPRSSA